MVPKQNHGPKATSLWIIAGEMFWSAQRRCRHLRSLIVASLFAYFLLQPTLGHVLHLLTSVEATEVEDFTADVTCQAIGASTLGWLAG